MEKKDLKSMTLEELTEFVKELGEKPFRAKQLYQWMHEKLAASLDECTNLPKAFREKLAENSTYTSLRTVKMLESGIDGTRKYLFGLDDGNVIESVLMKYHHGNSVCISSQVGCRMGCRFCASTLDGLTRNLRPSEMLDQIYRIQRSTGERVSNVVVMGSGEPMDNYDNLVRFIRLLSDENGLNISQRNITVSTCGIEKGLRELGESGLAYLAVSLHAPTQELRARIMPKAARWPLEDLLQALKSYPLKTRERITFEYLLLGGVNDGLEQARQLARVVSDVKGKLNLIVYNPSEGDPYKAPSPERVLAFEQYLWDRNITAIIRKSKGQDIKAACGQLKAARQNEAGEQA